MENMNEQGGYQGGGTPPPAMAGGATGSMPELGEALSKGWTLLVEDIGTWIGAIIVASVIAGVTFGILVFPMMAGLIYMALKKIKTGKIEFGDLFKGFQWFGPMFVYILIVAIASAVTFGLAGLFFGFCCYFVPALIVDRGMGFMDAIKESLKKFQESVGPTILFVLVISIVASAGSLVFGIGALVTAPLAIIAGAYAYDRVWGIKSSF